MSDKKNEVVAAVIIRKGRVLIAKRLPGDKWIRHKELRAYKFCELDAKAVFEIKPFI